MNKSVEASKINSYIDFDEFIGVFDSGMGGISTLIELIKAFPNERCVYFGDNHNAPYGTKTEEEIFNLSEEVVHSFVKAGAKAVVIACNTATSSSLERLKQKYDLPIIGIEPELEQAVIENTGKNILVLATSSTLSGTLYQQKREHYLQKKGKKAPKEIYSVAMPRFVELVESGKTSNSDISNAMKQIDEKILKSISAIVLGCTHFVFLKSQIFNYMNDLSVDVKLYEGSAKVIRSLSSQLHLKIEKKKAESNRKKNQDDQKDQRVQENQDGQKDQKYQRVQENQDGQKDQKYQKDRDNQDDQKYQKDQRYKRVQENQYDQTNKSGEQDRDFIEYQILNKQKRLLFLTSDSSKFDLMVELFNRYFNEQNEDSFSILMKSKHFTKRDLDALLEHVDAFLQSEKLDDLDRELVRAKYIACNAINIRNLARMHKKTLKYVSDRIIWLDNELFKFLSRKI